MDQPAFDAMLEAQGGGCAICSSGPVLDESLRWRADWDGWHVDHDHNTGIVRGILCPPCNLMLGYAKDRPDVLAAAVKYLATHIS